MKKYIVYKKTRLPTDESYMGPTFDVANIRHRYQKWYNTYNEAKEVADILSKFNLVGFDVFDIIVRDKVQSCEKM